MCSIGLSAKIPQIRLCKWWYYKNIPIEYKNSTHTANVFALDIQKPKQNKMDSWFIDAS